MKCLCNPLEQEIVTKTEKSIRHCGIKMDSIIIIKSSTENNVDMPI